MTATDRAIEAVEKEIETLRGEWHRKPADDDRLQRLFLKRDALQAKQFRALQRRLRKGAG